MTKDFDVHDDSTLSAGEFYQKYKKEESYEELDIFKDLSDDESHGNIKTSRRPIVAVNDVILKPAREHEELVRCLRERLHVHSTFYYTSVGDQRALADVLIMAIISQWPGYRKLAPDPFMTDVGNLEMKRRVAVYIIDTVERLFYHYVAKAEDWNSSKIFSTAANLSRLKTQILQETDECLNLSKIRRKILEKMRAKPKSAWWQVKNRKLIKAAELSFYPRKNMERAHREMKEKHMKELKNLPDLIEPEGVNVCNLFMKHHEATENHNTRRFTNNAQIPQQTGDESTKDHSQKTCTEHLDDEKTGNNHRLQRCDSMPELEDDSELHEEFQAMQNLPNRCLSVNQNLINDSIDRSNTKVKSLTNKEDLAKLVASVSKEERGAVILDEDFSSLLQVDNRRIIKKKYAFVEAAPLPLQIEDRSSKLEIYSDQPPVLNIKVPKQNIVRISDARISNRICASNLTLHKHAAIYNEFLNEIDEETMKTLDHHLIAGIEIRDVYNEITKYTSKNYLQFDQDDYVQNCAEANAHKEINKLFMSDLLHEKQYKRLVNDKLRVENDAPWKDYTNADEWRNEPKFAGIGREDMLLKINHKPEIKPTCQSMFMADIKMPTTGKIAQSHSAWLTWYRNNVNLDDYKKFLSKKETDFLCEYYHLYDSDDGDMDHNEVARTSPELEILKQREEMRQKLLATKNMYKKGYWNAQCVSLGGLGKEPEAVPDQGGNIEEEAKDENAMYTFLQDRLEQIWKFLKMPYNQRLNMAVKHSGTKSLETLAEVVDCWEDVSELIVQREDLIAKLETFERTASDPNRFFVKGPNGSSVARINETKTRGKLNKQIGSFDVKITPKLHFIKKKFNDDVTYQGRNYSSKMQSDRIEMLYWLQQERRKENLKTFHGNTTEL